MICGVGCDIVKIERLKQNQDQLAQRILSAREHVMYSSFTGVRQLQFLAGRYAAKEAIFKAHNEFKTISNIEILQINGKPECVIDGYTIHVSISHEDEYAIAYATCIKRGD